MLFPNHLSKDNSKRSIWLIKVIYFQWKNLIECIRDSMFYLVLNQLYSFTTEIIFILKFILILFPDSKEFEIF